MDNNIIVGLGNPGAKYENTKHNAGVIALAFFAFEIKFSFIDIIFEVIFNNLKHEGKELFFLTPQTFLIFSGYCVSKFIIFYKILVKVAVRGHVGVHGGLSCWNRP